MIRKARLVEIVGDRASVTFDEASIIRNVPVIGDPKRLSLNSVVYVQYVDERPVLLASGSQATQLSSSALATGGTHPHAMVYHTDEIAWHVGLSGAELHAAKLPIAASGIELEEIGTATYDDVQDKFNNTGSAGYINGGEITDSGSGQIDIATLQGYIRSSDSEIGTIKAFDLTGVINFALTDQQTNYIYVDYDGGTPVVKKTTTRSDIKQTWQFTLGRVFRDGNDLHIVQAGVQLANYMREDYERLLAVRGFEQSSGGTISETGNRYIESDAGEFYLGHNIVTTAGVDTSGAPTFTRHYHVAAAWASDQKSQICAAAYQYDNGTQLTNLSNNKYGVWWVYIHMDGDLHVVVGGGNYTLSEAQASTPPATPEIVGDFSILAARIILEEDGTNFTAVASAYLSAFNPAGGIDHNDTSNKQGGTTDEYYHFTTSEHTELSEWLDNVVLGSSGEIQLPNTALRLLDTGGDHYLTLKPNEDLDANYTLNIVVNDGDRTIDLGGNFTIDATASITGGGSIDGEEIGRAHV